MLREGPTQSSFGERTIANLQDAERFVVGVQRKKVGDILDAQQRETVRQRFDFLATEQC